MTIDIYTPSDLKKIKELLLEEQEGKDSLTDLEIPQGKAVTDHRHDAECLVRGVLHRNCNSALGRIENTFMRDLSWWYPHSISVFLRKAADYLEKGEDTRYRHSSFIKYLKVQFNKLTAKQQNKVLTVLGSIEGGNVKSRRDLFAKVVLDRNLGYNVIVETIEKESNYGLV